MTPDLATRLAMLDATLDYSPEGRCWVVYGPDRDQHVPLVGMVAGPWPYAYGRTQEEAVANAEERYG